MIWFGIGTLPAVITSFLISFFPITVNVAAGIATVEPELRDVLRALGAHPLTIVRKVGLPRSMPYYFASLKLAITSSFLGSILAETVAGQSGIGHLMIVASPPVRGAAGVRGSNRDLDHERHDVHYRDFDRDFAPLPGRRETRMISGWSWEN